jgi:uncharacterized protein (TIGR02266 family)
MVEDRTTGADQRRHERQPITLVVDYEGAEDMVGDFTENLSAGGTFVHTTRDFPVGTQVRLMLSFPGLLRPVSLVGVVRWARAGDDDQRGVGIEFVEGAEEIERLLTLMGRISTGDPRLVSRVMRVLVVEDNPHVERLICEGITGGMKRTFGDAVSFQFDTATNGRDALAKIANGKFDALIIDVYLPVMDGPSVIEVIRGDERTRSLPIIAVSAGGRPAREAALKAGADFFLEKPMRLRQIIESMTRLMALVEQPAPPPPDAGP